MNPQQPSERWSHSWRRSLFILRFQLIQWEDFRFIELLIKYFFSFWLLVQHEHVDKVTVWKLVMGDFYFFFQTTFQFNMI